MIFVDTWAWVALADRSDPYHRQAKQQHQEFVRMRRPYVTSDYVLSETITYLYDALPAVHAQAFINSLLAAADRGDNRLIHLSTGQFRRAWQMRQRYHDKPDISFVDFASMIVMQDLEITEVFTGDAHFEQVGLSFHLLPERDGG
jgi:predicted nucleic acid-binding protein